MQKAVESVVVPAQQFARDSYRLLARCTKPDWKEFTKIALSTSVGFAVLGFIGFAIKLVFMPINNVIVSSS